MIGTRTGRVGVRGRIGLGLAFLAWGWVGTAQGQEPAGGTVATPPASSPGLDLVRAPGTRFQLVERYRGPDQAEGESRIGAYRVAFWESIETTIEMPRAASQKNKTVVLAKCSELPVVVEGDVVLGMVRRYDSFRVEPDRRKLPSDPLPLDGRELWLKRSPRGVPIVLRMGEGRPLSEPEFRFAADQHVYMPDLVDLLPPLPVRVGETWSLEGDGARALLGGPIVSGELKGELLRVDAVEGDATKVHAVIGVSGRAQSPVSVAAVNAELEFEFLVPDLASQPAAAESGTAGRRIVARGAIVRLSLTQQETMAAADGSRDPQRGQINRTRQVVLERRLGLPGVVPLNAPSEIPTPTRMNSWLRSTDESGRFSFDHPQDFISAPIGPDEEGIHLMRPSERGPDDIFVAFKPRDRSDGEELARTAVGGWTSVGFRVERGPAGWLPEADWDNRQVYRFDLTLTPSASATDDDVPLQAAFQSYLVRFSRDAAAHLQAMTARTDPSKFQGEVAEIVKSFQLDEPKAATPAAPTAISTPAPAATEPAAPAPLVPPTPPPLGDAPPPIPRSSTP